MTRLPATLIAAVIACTAIAGVHAEERYTGMCDASAAVSIGHGRFVVADDELDVLRVYQKSTSGPVDSVSLIDYLKNSKDDEGDLEGAAAIDDRIYWISSHARKGSDGSVDRHRMRFFATTITGAANTASVAAIAKPPYETLLDDLLKEKRFDVLAKASKNPPEAGGGDKDDGLNIEGLAAAPKGKLLIGFRNPQQKKMALVVMLNNPKQVVEHKATPDFGDLIRLDLGGRGIRSIELVKGEFLIVAGPRGEAKDSPVKPAFVLYRWSGSVTEQPKRVRDLDDGSFRPEALFFDSESKELVMLSDDGDELVDGKACKRKKLAPEKQSFRAKRLAWP